MIDHGLLANLLLTYGIALVFVVGLARLRVPSIVALMLAGIVAGPSAAGIISSAEDVEMLAELGIVLLLFTVGLDFSMTAVRQIWRTILVAGVLQIVGTAALIMVLEKFAGGVTTELALFIGLFVALSSTAIVLKGLAERNELTAPHGRLSVGILLLQDLAIVVLLLLVPILSGKTPVSEMPLALLRALGAIAGVAAASRVLLPQLLRLVTSSGRREAFPLAVVVASVGTAWAGSMLGLSMAVGAFLAGLMLAESEFSHQAYAEVRPVRDVLSGLFFISLGMLVNFSMIVERLPLVIAAAAAIVVLKACVAGIALAVSATPLRVAVASAIGLSQVGEFSFILGRAGLDSGLLPSDLWQVMLGASVATMIATPSLLAMAPGIALGVTRLANRVRSPVPGTFRAKVPGTLVSGGKVPATFSERVPGTDGTGIVPTEDEIADLARHVIILGFGAGGRLVARAMRDLGIPYLVLELNGATVQQERAHGERIMYGDAMSPESLEAAHVDRALAIVSLLSDPDATRRMVRLVRQHVPSIPIIARARYRLEAERLKAEGTTVAVAEELEASLEVLAQLLARLDIAGNVIEPLLDIFRRESVSLRPMKAPHASPEGLPQVLRDLPVSTHRVDGRDWAARKTMTEINLRARTGATVLAIHRSGAYVTPVPPDEQVSPGDVLYLVGDESDILLSRRLLTSGE
jgi:CPA2 family monovalent cation:H+ antiporter-2